MRISTQITFDFDSACEVRRRAARPREAVEQAARQLANALARQCARGDCAVPEHKLIESLAKKTCGDQDFLRAGLRRAIRARLIAREKIKQTPWLFPRDLRDAELTVARLTRQLAEGTAVIRSAQARLEKLALLCCADPYRVIDLLNRLLARVPESEYAPTILAPGTIEATWFQLKLGRPVIDLTRGLRSMDPGPSASSIHLSPVSTTMNKLIVVLDASRMDLESMAATMERVPPHSALVLIGNQEEIPRWGHGQPFQDLVRAGVFQCVQVRAMGNNPVAVQSALVKRPRRSALFWRLRRGAGLDV